MTLKDRKTAENLLSFIQTAVSPFHVTQCSAARLKEGGFKELFLADDWELEENTGYYVQVYGASIVAFFVGGNMRKKLRISAAHTDFPCFRIKPAAAIAEHGYRKLNIEPYGGMILNTWLDRPLSMAGKVVLRGREIFSPQTIFLDCQRALLTIPNLAIHMNRKVNEGLELNKQKDMLPLFSMAGKDMQKEDFFLAFLARELKVEKTEILSYELNLYPVEAGCLFGMEEEFVSAPRLDNITSVKACLEGILQSKKPEGLHVMALFDHEEVGSRTKQGGASLLLPQLLERIYAAMGYTRPEYLADVAGGFLLSVDVAHALHPNSPEKSDVTNKPLLNGGVALKVAASQSYAGDGEAVAAIAALCQAEHIPCQYFANRSDAAGGSTLGSMLSALMPMRTMDIGLPVLAMHSVRETMGMKDQQALEDLLKAFYQQA